MLSMLFFRDRLCCSVLLTPVMPCGSLCAWPDFSVFCVYRVKTVTVSQVPASSLGLPSPWRSRLLRHESMRVEGN